MAFGSEQWMYNAGGGFYPHEIDQSLRFNDDDSAYLGNSFATNGTDRKKITLSCWYKKTTTSAIDSIFNNFGGSGAYGQVVIDANNRIEVFSGDSSETDQAVKITSAVLRDPSAWYHVFVSIDTTQADAS